MERLEEEMRQSTLGSSFVRRADDGEVDERVNSRRNREDRR